MLGLRQEPTRLRFQGMNHRLLPQGLTHREGGRMVVREAQFGRQRKVWMLVKETKLEVLLIRE